MKARDIMTPHVISVGPDTTVDAVAETMTAAAISAVPVIDIACRLLGIVSEGDLIRRHEIGSERRRAWWLGLFKSVDAVAADFVKARAVRVKDIMTWPVQTVGPDTPVGEIAEILETNGIKRVPVVEKGRVIGIVSRANLVQTLVALRKRDLDVDRSDEGVRDRILKTLENTPWANRPFNIVVHEGKADLWGGVYSAEEQRAIRVAAEATPGVSEVRDHLRVLTPTLDC